MATMMKRLLPEETMTVIKENPNPKVAWSNGSVRLIVFEHAPYDELYHNDFVLEYRGRPDALGERSWIPVENVNHGATASLIEAFLVQLGWCYAVNVDGIRWYRKDAEG